MKPPKDFEVPFSIGDRVLVDGDSSVQATVTALCWRATMPEVEISWFNDGQMCERWIAPWRLNKVT